jgi:hypothetical protein
MANTNFSLQISKLRSIKGFGENISQLSLCVYVLISISPFSIWSLRKWCLLSRCIILLWKTRFLATKIALVLSHIRGTLSKITLKSLMMCTIHRIWEQQLLTQPLWWIGQLKIVFERPTNKRRFKK